MEPRDTLPLSDISSFLNFFYFEIGSHEAAGAGLEFEILPPQPKKKVQGAWDKFWIRENFTDEDTEAYNVLVFYTWFPLLVNGRFVFWTQFDLTSKTFFYHAILSLSYLPHRLIVFLNIHSFLLFLRGVRSFPSCQWSYSFLKWLVRSNFSQVTFTCVVQNPRDPGSFSRGSILWILGLLWNCSAVCGLSFKNSYMVPMGYISSQHFHHPALLPTQDTLDKQRSEW